MYALNDTEYRALLNAHMCADPHPWSDDDDRIIESLLNTQAVARGYESWTVAFHQFQPDPAEGEPTPVNPHAAVIGTPSMGFSIYGPFPNSEDATLWADGEAALDWWVLPIDPPDTP